MKPTTNHNVERPVRRPTILSPAQWEEEPNPFKREGPLSILQVTPTHTSGTRHETTTPPQSLSSRLRFLLLHCGEAATASSRRRYAPPLLTLLAAARVCRARGACVYLLLWLPIAPQASRFAAMAPSRHADEGGQLQLMEPDRVDEEECFESIDKLIAQGINAGDVKKLQDAGIYTCNGLMMHTKKSLTGIKGLSEAKVDKICEAAEKLLSQGFMTGSDLLLKVRKLDLIYYRPERIVPIAERFGMDANAVLDNIIYARAYTYEHQYNLLLGIAAKMAEEPFRLLIVDSVIALFRVDFSGRGELAERQQKLAQMLSRLTKIAEEFNVAVYITNQVIADPGGGINDRKLQLIQIITPMTRSFVSLDQKHVFQVTSGGIMDAKD
nr:unnamed protein product [Digitaria exilis]